MSTRSSRDEGVSLVELVMSITIIALLSGVLVGVFSVVLRAVPDVDARTDEARTLQGVVTWLPQDVDSTPPTGFDRTPATASGCTLNQGTNLLRMEWTENVGTPIRYVANYRAVPVTATVLRIERITCFGSGAGPLGNARTQVVSAELPALPSTWVPGELPIKVDITMAGGDVELVTFQVRTQSGKIVRTDSAPKNPANTLPPTSGLGTPSTDSTTTTTTEPPTTTTSPPTTLFGDPTTTTTTTTTLPATTTTVVPCALLFPPSIAPTQMTNTDPNGNGKSNIKGVGVLQNPVTITVITNGFCAGIDGQALANPGGVSQELIRGGTRVGDTFTIVYPGYPSGTSELWQDGTRPIRIVGPMSVVLATVNLEVK